MDLLFYIIVIGIGVAAGNSSGGYDDYPAIAMEEPADDGYAEDEGEDYSQSEDVTEEESEDFAAVAPEPEPEPEPQPEAKQVPGFGIARPPPAAVQPAQPAAPEPAQPASGEVAEEQVVTGRMTTATEVRPILTATKPSWVAVRDWDGSDLLYFTNLLSWRCGLYHIEYSINGSLFEELQTEPCYVDENAPNALKVQDIQPYITLPPGSVENLIVKITYDDLSTDAAEYQRAAIQID